MQNESQAAESRLLEASASKTALHDFPEVTVSSHTSARSHRAREASTPSSLFRYRVVKRIVDILVILLSLPVLLPALLIVAAVVKATSPGPIFFSHRRICRGGAFFSMWKFRTMCQNSSDVLEKYLAQHPPRPRRVEQDPQAAHGPTHHPGRPLPTPLLA